VGSSANGRRRRRRRRRWTYGVLILLVKVENIFGQKFKERNQATDLQPSV
jgi:hypothetical protein